MISLSLHHSFYLVGFIAYLGLYPLGNLLLIFPELLAVVLYLHLRLVELSIVA